jgi:hypothetical protein
MNKKLFWILISILILFLLPGIIFGSIHKELSSSLKACECSKQLGNIENPSALENGEKVCNSQSVQRGVFINGIINIQRICSADQIIVCNNWEKVREYSKVIGGTCEYKFTFFKCYQR